MIESELHSFRSSRQLFSVCIALVLILGSCLIAPQAAAQNCTFNGPGTDVGTVVFQSCFEAKNGSNVSFLDLTYPGTVNSGDLIIVQLATHGNERFYPPAGWEVVIDRRSSNANLAILKRIADGSEDGTTIRFRWGSNEQVIGNLLRFTNATGATAFDNRSGNNASPRADGFNPGFANYLALRVGGFDDDNLVIDPGTIITGHQNINQDASNSGTTNESLGVAYQNFVAGGASANAFFTLNGTERWTTSTIAIEFGTPSAPTPTGQGCPKSDGTVSGSQLVVFESCSSQAQATNVNNTTVDKPAGVVEGDLMIAFIATDANENIAPPAGWSEINEAPGDGNALTLGVYSRVAGAAEPANYQWTTGTTEQYYSNILRFTDASGLVVSGFAIGTSNAPTAPTINTAVANSLVLRVSAHDDDDIGDNPIPIISGQTSIDANFSASGGGTVSSQKTYLNQPAVGATGTAVFATLQGDQWRGGTIAVEPIEFRFSTVDGSSGTSSICTVEQITLSVTDKNGAAMTWFDGQVTLSASNSTGAAWSYSGTGLSNGVNGNATYQFQASDDGTVTLDYYNPNDGVTVDFSVSYTSGSRTFSESTTSTYTPATLSITDCEFVVSFEAGNQVGTCGIEAVTVALQDLAGNAATNYSGTLTIDNGSGSTFGSYTLNTGVGANFTDAVAGDGLATYAFSITPAGGESNEVIFDYSHGSTTLTAITFDISENSGLAIAEDASNPSLAVAACEIRITYTGVTAGTNADGDTCSPTEMIIQVVNEAGTPIVDYAGTVLITNNQTVGSYAQPGAVGTLNNASGGGANNGQAAYTFNASEDGSTTLDFSVTADLVPTIDFQIVETSTPTFLLSPTGSFDADIDIAPCTWDFQVATSSGVCKDSEAITITIRGRDDLPVSGFVGQIQIANVGYARGDYALTNAGSAGGLGTLANTAGGGADNGTATYTFLAGDNGVVNLDFSTTLAADDVTFTVTSLTAGIGLAFDVDSQNVLDVLACEVRISVAAGPIDVCSIIQVTYTITDTAGTAIPGFDGSIELKAESNQGNWSSTTVPGTLNNNDGGPDNGRASYQFAGTEVGTAITLDFRHPSVNGTLSFDASDDLDAVSSINVSAAGGQDPSINVQGCTVVVSTPDTSLSNVNQANVCAAGERVIYTVTNSLSNTATSFKGLIVLQADGVISDVGDYAKAVGAPTGVLGGYGAFDNGAGNDGIATYTFAPDDATPGDGDLGVFEVVYTTNTADVVTFGASTTGITAAGADRALTFNDCVARISFPDDLVAPFEADVCTIERVRFLIVGFNGETVTNYAGNIALSTSTTLGTWVDSDVANLGALSNGTVGNGGASYNFVAGDGGDVILDFLHAGDNASAVNINVTGTGGVSDPGTPGTTFDPNLFVDVCTFQISYDGGGGSAHNDFTKTACTVQEVTIEIFRSASSGSGLATDYNGTVQLSTSLNHGNWSDATVSVTDVSGDDDGQATVVFVSTGAVTIDFVNLNTETMSVNAIDLVNGLNGAIIEDGAADPDLIVTSCSPTITAQSCAADGVNFADITIDAQNTNSSLRGRMVLMAMTWEGNDTLSSAQFDALSAGSSPNFAMTEIISELRDNGSFDSNTFLYGILDTNLPATGGSFRGSYTKPGVNSVGMCLLYLTDVEQSFPTQTVSGTSNPVDPVNSSSAINTKVANTAITTTQNNAFVISVIGAGSGSNSDAVFFDLVSPNPPMTQLFARNDDPVGSDFTASTGVSANAGLFTIDETYSSATGATPNIWTHLVASFNPIISGPPVPVGYVPVTLFKTYSGDISYVAMGATLRAGNNGSGQACTFVASRSGQLNLPEIDETDTGTYPGIVNFGTAGNDPDSEILDAYLYWMASGDQEIAAPGTGYNTVRFVTPSGTTAIDADELFVIDNVGSSQTNDFYSAYKRVTDLMPAMGSINGTYNVLDIDISNGTPWSDTEACGGGWSLIVVYKNPYEEFRVVNLFHGFQPFQNSAFTLVPRNFRMAKDGGGATETPNGLVTHVTLEGDETLSTGDESLKIQDQPGSTNANLFFTLDTPFNPPGTEFNGTVTRPVFELVDTDASAGVNYKYQWDPTASNVTNRNGGYEIDFPGVVFPPSAVALSENGGSWGMDIDTHYISGDQEAAEGADDNVLFDFADQQTEEITTRYSSGQDLVLLVHEAISVENVSIADIEVTITEGSGSTYKVGSIGNTYDIVVKNNGNGADSFGTASGSLILVGTVPAGMTLTSVAGTGWTCTIGTLTLTNDAFTCTNNISSLGATPLNTVVATVTIAAPDVGSLPIAFPSLNNNARVITRVTHINDNQTTPAAVCTTGLGIGLIPDPDTCNSSAEFDNVNDLQGGVVDLNDLDQKTSVNNNVDSVVTVVKGIETELAITKAIVSLLENDGVVSGGGAALYTLTVTNNGPDPFVYSAGNREIKIVDDEPGGIDFASASGTDWTCPITSGSPDQMNCAFTPTPVTTAPFNLAVGASTVVTVSGYVTGTPGALVSNTATVSTGLYNFDQTGTNNTSTNNTNITAPVASATERFLLSVSSGGASSIGDGSGALSFTDNDLIIYNPVQDTAVMYLDNSALSYGLNDPDAVHLLPNGHVVLSTASASTIGSNAQAFSENDLVLWDPITGLGSLFFDQDNADPTNNLDGENIDAVYILDGGVSGDFIFSTTNDVSDGAGPKLDWNDSDLIKYTASTDSFSIYLNGEDAQVFNGTTADIDAAYLRTNTSDPYGTPLNEFFFSSDNQNTTIGGGAIFGQDDVVEFIPNTIPDPASSTSETIFRGNVPIGVFSTPSGTDVDTARKLNALHVLEDGYLGHFSVIQSQAGNACTAGEIRIVKHLNIAGHATDTSYTGSIEITGDTVGGADAGTWTIVSGNGTLNNNAGGSTTNGQAVYTYVGSDNGDVTLGLNVTEDPPVSRSIDVNVDNRLVQELGIEDDDFDFNLVVSNVTYRDEVSSAAYNNSDGVAAWAGPWTEVDDTGSGASSGKANALGGKLNLTSTPSSGTVPSLSREANLEPFDVTETVFLNFDYSYANANAIDVIQLFVTVDGTELGGVATPFATYTGLSGTNASATAVSLNISDLAPTDGSGDKFTGITKIEFRVGSGYTTSGVFSIDNVEIATGTTDCNFGSFDHFDIIVNEIGLACVVSAVRIEGHDATHTLTAPGIGSTIALSTSTFAGSWPSKITGAGALSEVGNATDGAALYTFPADETFVELNFNYTNPDAGLDNSPMGDNQVVNINIDGTISGITKTECKDGNAACSNDHDPSITFDEVGLIFTTGDNLVTTTPTAIPFQISGKPSTTAPFSALPTIQLVRSVLRTGNEASACSSLVPDGSLVTIKIAAVCDNPINCSAGVTQMPFVNDVTPTPATVNIPVYNMGTVNPAGSGADIQLLFENTGTTVDGTENIAAVLDFSFPDAGKITFHAQYDIPFDNDNAGTLSGDFAKGSSNSFVVRPFGFDIDFSGDRRSNSGVASVASDPTGATGPAFARAGVGFSTTVAAVAWQSGDDVDQDGNPAFGTDLSDNPITANFGKETGGYEPVVLVDVVTQITNPGDNLGNPGAGGVVGSISSGAVFDGFDNGVSTHDMAINEVGIFDLNAVLVVDSGNSAAENYLEETASEGVVGGTVDVGRFYPAYFSLASGSLENRYNQMCSAPPKSTSAFTYMGEDFRVNFSLQAKNALDADAQNYFGDFAKLTKLSELNIKAIIEGATSGSDVSSRLEFDTFTPIDTSDDLISTWASGGLLTVSANIRFKRMTTGEDGPFTNVEIAFAPVDINGNGDVDAGNDVQIGSGYAASTTTSSFDVDIDNVGANVFQQITGAATEFRYGRLRLVDSFGSETEPLGIGVVAEYWDGSNFVSNIADSCTAVNFEVVDPSLAVVAGSAVPADYVTPDTLVVGDVPIESGTAADFDIVLSAGQTDANDLDGVITTADADRPFTAGPTTDSNVGSVIVELDLSNSETPRTTLDFLTYDWRADTELDLYEEIPDGTNYGDNPRAIIEFGSYRGHDRVINWQEIYIGPN